MSANGSGSSRQRIEVHLGKVLHKLANTYPTLLLTVVEAAQNAIDADATKVLIAIDQQASRVVVVDDGKGVTVEKFGLALSSVGDSIKRKGSLGQFGLGLISPLDKCESYVFMSRPDGQTVANRWQFDGASIKTQREVDIPHRDIDALPVVPTPFRSADRRLNTRWNTMVLLDGITQDRTIRTVLLDDLEHQIRVKLSNGMRRKGTTVHVVINDDKGQVASRDILPMEYTGEPLEEVVYHDADCGEVRFRLYRAPKTREGRRGEVVVMRTDDLYPISWREFRTQAMGSKYLTEFLEAFAVLGSGYFEGVVTMQNVVLDPQRTKFVMNDALLTGYMVIDRWFRDHGRKHYETEQEQRREERYKELGERSLGHLLDRIGNDPQLSSVLEELFASPERKSKAEREQQPTGKSSTRRRRTIAEAKPKPASDDPDTRRAPAILRFAYEAIPGFAHLWQYDWDAATIVFNIMHPIWVMLDETDGKRTTRHDKQIMHLQLFVGLEIIMMLADAGDRDEFEDARNELDKRVRPYARTIIEPMK